MHNAQALSALGPASSSGGQEPMVSLLDFHPPNRPGLADQVMLSLLPELSSYGLTPTRSMSTGLYAAARALEAMAEGTLSPQFHLSSLDPGVGKTTLIRHFIMALLASPHHKEVSVLVCVSRLEELATMLHGLTLYQSEVSVWTGDEDLNAKMSTPPDQARILLTTQQKLEAVCGRHSGFTAATGFHYLDQPRQVRIWDESLLPGQEILLSEDDLAGLWGHFRQSAPKLFGSLQDLHKHMKQATTGELIDVLTLEEMGGAGARAEMDRLLDSNTVSSLDRQRLECLQQAAGETLPVHRTNHGEAKLLDYRDSIPEDLAPMVVFDASGRCRQTYMLMEQHRDTLVRLTPATKDYSNLHIGLWSRGSGKTAHANDTEEVLVRGIAQKIMERPNEEWLILHHKDGLATFKARVEAHLGDGMTRTLHVLSWGRHHGTNAFARVPNVIFASLLHLPQEVHEARVRLCAGRDPTEAVTAAECREMALGELLHNVLQALCRASVRGLQADGTCLPCRAYIIAPKQTGLAESLPDLFPNCQLARWCPSGTTKLTKSIREALAQVDQWDAEGFGDEVAYPELAEAIGMDRRDFNKRVVRDPRFKDEVTQRGYVEDSVVHPTSRGSRTAKGLVRDEVFPADPSPLA